MRRYPRLDRHKGSLEDRLMKSNSYAYAAALAVLLASAPLANASDDKAAGPGTDRDRLCHDGH